MKTKLDHITIRNLPTRDKTYIEWDSLQNNFGVRVYKIGGGIQWKRDEVANEWTNKLPRQKVKGA